MAAFDSIKHFHSAIENGSISCVQAVEHYLTNIREKHFLNAIIFLYEEEALERAKALDEKKAAGKPCGKLFGVVITLKDVLSYKGHPLTAASKILEGFEAVYSATAVQRLLDEDAIIIGSCNCDEFAMGSTNEHSIYGKTLNPIDNERVPGGSSGGSAVAVSANLCMVSLGSDTGGSVRQPADFCGIAGLKPTYGRISRYGLVAYASSFDAIGIFAKNIEDIALVLEVIAGKDEFDATVSSQPVDLYSSNLEKNSKIRKIGYFKQAFETDALDPEIKTSLQNFTQQLSKEGYSVQPIDFELLDYIVPTYYVLTTAEASSNLSRFDGIRYGYRSAGNTGDLTSLYKKSRSEGFNKEVKKRILLGNFVLSAGYYDAYFGRAQQVRKMLIDKINLIFKDLDAIILPTAPTTAFKNNSFQQDPIAMYMADIFTVLANLTGNPAISIPIFWHSNGMPYGLQVMSAHFTELSLLQLSKNWLENFKNRR